MASRANGLNDQFDNSVRILKNLKVDGTTIGNTITPTSDDNLVNKKYVDDEISGIPVVTPDGNSGEVQFNELGAFKADSDFFWDNTNKRLGIGTDSPDTPLHLETSDTTDPSITLETTNHPHKLTLYLDESASSNLFNIDGSSQSVSTVLNVKSKAGQSATLRVASGSSVAFGWLVNPDGNSFFQNYNSDKDIIFDINDGGVSTEVMRVRGSTSSVGIGTTTPNEKLHVVGRVIEQGTFAEIYCYDESTPATISSSSAYTQFTNYTTNGESANCTADATNSKITITKAGRYFVSCQMDGYIDTANVNFDAAIFLDGTIQNQIKAGVEFVAVERNQQLTLTGFIDSAANKDVDIRFRQQSGGDVDATIVNSNLNVQYLGET